MAKDKTVESSNTQEEKQTCGLIMPISGSDGYTATHWADVKFILEEVIIDAGFNPNIVSDADEVGLIHNRIVNNIINNPIVVCDVSSKNPNVMFELGLRLAFDKATIIVKDDATNYSFDTGVIEHLEYPKDLRYASIQNFKIKLKEKIDSTYKASKKPEYSTFLKSYVQYKPQIETKEVGSQEYIIKQLEILQNQIASLKSSNSNFSSKNHKVGNLTIYYPYLEPLGLEFLDKLKSNEIEDNSKVILDLTSKFAKHLREKESPLVDIAPQDTGVLVEALYEFLRELVPKYLQKSKKTGSFKRIY